MIEIRGKSNSAKVFTDNIDDTTISQITELCDQEFVSDSKIRIMPDCHAGAGCVIGTTMTIKDKAVPNLVGVDIGCGMYTVKFSVDDELDLINIARFIRKKIPSGFGVNSEILKEFPIEDLRCFDELNKTDRLRRSLGSLGGGNHFWEISVDTNGSYYLIVHSGSRNLGKQVADYYQNTAYNELNNDNHVLDHIVSMLKREGRHSEIEAVIKSHKQSKPKINKQLAYCEGKLLEDYLHDMNITQKFANENRKLMIKRVVEEFGFNIEYEFSTIHNYIDTESMILRKGAVSAELGERLLIPINMRDGSLLCVGKGNLDWNYSAPHGAGRLMSRKQAKENISIEQYKNSMNGIYSTSVNMETLDEAPFAYKPIEEIISNIGDTVEIVDILKPIFNFKAS